MIRGPKEFVTDVTIEADVVVVGAGPIGIVTALELARSGVQVALIESGLERTAPAAQGLATLDSRQDDYFHSRSELTVRRQVGGTSALWGGRCVKFDPIDFEDRPITAQAPWPIGDKDIEPYRQSAAAPAFRKSERVCAGPLRRCGRWGFPDRFPRLLASLQSPVGG